MTIESTTLNATESPTSLVSFMVAHLDANPPTTLAEARVKLQDLLTHLRASIEETLAAAHKGAPDYQAILSEASVRVEAVENVVAALAAVTKGEAVAQATLDRVFAQMHAPRVEARVWRKLRPADGHNASTVSADASADAGCTGPAPDPATNATS